MEGRVFCVPVYKVDENGVEMDWADEPEGWKIKLSMGKMSPLISDRVYKTQDGAEKAACRWLHFFPHTDWDFY